MNKTIGILGGMGPQASAYFYKLLIDMSVNEFDARNNNDFPEVLLYSVPVPDFISDTSKKNEALNMLKLKTRNLNKVRAGQIGIACNTAHVLLPELQNVSKTRFISMIEEVTSGIKGRKVGLLGTPTLIKLGLYQKELEKRGIKVILPDKKQVAMLDRVIRYIISGKVSSTEVNGLLEIADSLASNGAEGIILGCTELPLIFPKKYKVPIYNSSEILARALLRNYYN